MKVRTRMMSSRLMSSEVPVTREDFVREYARRSGVSDQYVRIGIIDVRGVTMIALPCGCGEPECMGWAMVFGDGILDHLQFRAPAQLRDAYEQAVSDANKCGHVVPLSPPGDQEYWKHRKVGDDL